MALNRIKRHLTPFGQIFHKRGPAGTNLLVTKNGKRLRLDFPRLMKAAHVTVENGVDVVRFSGDVHPKALGEGVHGMAYRLFPAQEAKFVERSAGSGLINRPSVVLKVYRASLSKNKRPDGFTQFFANSAIYNYLKKTPSRLFEVRSLHTYFVSEKMLVRKYINAPTLGESLEMLQARTRGTMPGHELGTAFTNEQILRFLKKNEISLEELNAADDELIRFVKAGQKNYFNTKFPIEHDANIGNVYVLGKTRDGKILFSLADQGMNPVRGLADRIRKGTAF